MSSGDDSRRSLAPLLGKARRAAQVLVGLARMCGEIAEWNRERRVRAAHDGELAPPRSLRAGVASTPPREPARLPRANAPSTVLTPAPVPAAAAAAPPARDSSTLVA